MLYAVESTRSRAHACVHVCIGELLGVGKHCFLKGSFLEENKSDHLFKSKEICKLGGERGEVITLQADGDLRNRKSHCTRERLLLQASPSGQDPPLFRGTEQTQWWGLCLREDL